MAQASFHSSDAAAAAVDLDALMRREMNDALMVQVQETAARWHKRQREAMQALSALLHALMLSRDPVRTAEVWMDWHDGALERLIAEARDQRELSLALARCCGDGRLLEPHGGESASLPGGVLQAHASPQRRMEVDDE